MDPREKIMKGALTMKTKPIDKDDLCYVEEEEEIGLTDYVPGSPDDQLTFGDNFVPSDEPMLKKKPEEKPPEILVKPIDPPGLFDNRTLRSVPNGITPPVDGEYFTLKRGFTFRVSTLRKLNELRVTYPDATAYTSTIVDDALNFYHAHIFKDKKSLL